MGNYSIKERQEMLHADIKVYTEAADKIAGIMQRVGEEGLWIALGIDIFLITGEVTEDDYILFEQRKVINAFFGDDGIIGLLAKDITIPGLKYLGSDAKIPNPLAPIARMLLPYGILLNKTEKYQPRPSLAEVREMSLGIPEKGVTAIAGPIGLKGEKAREIWYPIKIKYLALPLEHRVMLTLAIPGITRLFLKIAGEMMPG